jgi:riboflavin biosynthesis pyrimidine reductase
VSAALREIALRPLMGTDQPRGLVRGGDLPAALADRYGGGFAIPMRTDRPTIVANFVSTIDGVIAFDTSSGNSGGDVSGHFEPDRLVMAILRSLADAVLVGAGTVRADARGRWTSASVHPDTRVATAALREGLGLTANPTTVVVTASGDLDLAHPGLSDPRIPVLVVTTPRGHARLVTGRDIPDNVELFVTGSDRVNPRALVELLAERGFRVVLCEGGPHLMGELFAANLVDELFLTVAPQIAGRTPDADTRLSLVEGRAFPVGGAPWAELVDLRSAANHLFARYRFGGSN